MFVGLKPIHFISYIFPDLKSLGYLNSSTGYLTFIVTELSVTTESILVTENYFKLYWVSHWQVRLQEGNLFSWGMKQRIRNRRFSCFAL